ncbi:unnamed protein product [Rotaria socialis]|uniref:Uncharacterized protein n=1 Tax=Rotaria socialis TaxID=392032 RepID=A0A818F1I8_9BILA|nr:unnamed protein product [Rotaria socialis]
MKSKDLQKLVLSKYENSDGTTKIFHDLNGTISLSTIERWYRRIRESGSISLFIPPGRQRTIRMKGAFQKSKTRLNRQKLVSSRNEDVMEILFSDKKMFDIDGVYNFQNDRIWAVSRSEFDTKSGIRQKRKFPQKVMV